MQRGAHEHVPVQRLGEEGPVLREAGDVLARRDALAKRQQRQIDVRQDDQREQPQQRRREQQRQHQAAVPAALSRRSQACCPPRRPRGKADRPLRIEAEAALRAPTCRSAKAPGLRQRDAKLDSALRASCSSTAELAPSNSTLCTSPAVRRLAGRQLGRRAAEHRDLRAHECLDRLARRDRAVPARAHHPAAAGGHFHERAVDGVTPCQRCDCWRRRSRRRTALPASSRGPAACRAARSARDS